MGSGLPCKVMASGFSIMVSSFMSPIETCHQDKMEPSQIKPCAFRKIHLTILPVERDYCIINTWPSGPVHRAWECRISNKEMQNVEVRYSVIYIG